MERSSLLIVLMASPDQAGLHPLTGRNIRFLAGIQNVFLVGWNLAFWVLDRRNQRYLAKYALVLKFDSRMVSSPEFLILTIDKTKR
ncbi:hypothetical protein NC99_30670 [Sunxiuqinia dokdonensis]|uniref:Uncharacterized protein n=1 Tax=Sunxiuqinia dokdonensis TaxID=1409788 RepID=A0A0L8V6K6_9BACT|nr:hypothetical protein NC99_30670 [Sunxiuqinia dokdonensis]